MGSDRDGLINQAMFMFARLNGFLEAADGAARGAARVVPAAQPKAQAQPPPAFSPARDPAPLSPHAPMDEPPVPKPEDDPIRREVAERVLETAAELERLIKGKGQYPDDEPMDDNGMHEPEAAEPKPDAGLAAEGVSLYLAVEGGEMNRIAKDRFVIGRGKHCDFVINSGKVSREHAVILREGLDYYIEDLSSSNGTWFNKQRIKRRKIENGDEYYICSEKIKLVMQ